MSDYYSRLVANIKRFVGAKETPGLLAEYYSGSDFSGAYFDFEQQLKSPRHNRLTTEDFAAVAMLSIKMEGWSMIALLAPALQTQIEAHLSAIPVDLHIGDATDDHFDQLYALQTLLDGVWQVGEVTRSKLLAHKRPHLVPIRDRYVVAELADSDREKSITPGMHAVFADDTNGVKDLIDRVRRNAAKVRADRYPNAPNWDLTNLPDLRVIDVAVWMIVHGQ